MPPDTHSLPLALLGARLIDPISGVESRGGLLVRDGRISGIGAGVTRANVGSNFSIIECAGDVLAPGLVDMQAFVGEPGAEYRETIASATAAAAAGGVTTLVSRPDTFPPVDDPAVVDFLLRRARDTGRVHVLPMATLTRGREGREISEIGLLADAGAVAFSDAGHFVADARVMRRALTYAGDFDALVVHFAQDRDLAAGGVMHEGEMASRLGLPGIPIEAEVIALERDMRLVELTGARYHAATISTARGLAVIEAAKARGLRVTCGVSINNLTLNENDIGDYRTFLKLRPPLRPEEDRMALVQGVARGTVDVIVSDHDPQDVETKRQTFAESAFGAIGVETMLPAALRLVHSGDVSLPRLLRAMSSRPADILKLACGRLQIGAPADLVQFDPDEPFLLDPETLHSRCKNTPFDEARLQGRVKRTLVSGIHVYEASAP